MSTPRILNKNHHDISQIFLVYMTLVGDAEKTALALDLDPSFVRELALKEGWAAKVARISVMSKSGQPGDWERAQNRALNFVQCHQLRRHIDEVILGLGDKDVIEMLTSVDGNGVRRVTAKLFTDLAKAMSMVHEMTYAALGDTPKEREKHQGDGDSLSNAGLHAALIASLNRAKLDSNPSEKLVKGAVEAVCQITQGEQNATQ